MCITDHRGLSALTNLEFPLLPKIRRWIADLTGFEIELRHVSGDSDEIQMADWLSRTTTSSGLHDAMAYVGVHKTPSEPAMIRVPTGSALVAAVRQHPVVPQIPGLSPILHDILSTTASKRLSGALKSSLTARTLASAWRWDSSRPENDGLAHLQARRKWLEAAELEGYPDQHPLALVNVLTVGLPSPLQGRIRAGYASDAFFTSERVRTNDFREEDGLWFRRS